MRLLALIACAAVVGLGGCDSDDDPTPDARPETATDSEAAPGPPLSPARYRQIERLYRLQLGEIESDADAERSIEATLRACRRVEESDPLLAAMVDGCEQTLGVLGTSLADFDCATPAACAREFRTIAGVFDRLLDSAAASNRAVRNYVTDPECRGAMITSSQAIDAVESGGSAFRAAAKAIEGGDQEALDQALKDMKAASADFDRAAPSRAQLRDFRRACRPAA